MKEILGIIGILVLLVGIGDGLRKFWIQRLLDLKSAITVDPIMPLARVGLARAYVLANDKARSRVAYQDFFALWKDADPDVPVLRDVKAEYAKLQ